jgi:hypothetical protein
MVYRTASDAVFQQLDGETATVTIDWTTAGAPSNNREAGGQGTFMYLLNIDVQALLQWNMSQAAGSRLFDPSDRTGAASTFRQRDEQRINGGTPPQPSNYGVRVFDWRSCRFPQASRTPPIRRV